MANYFEKDSIRDTEKRLQALMDKAFMLTLRTDPESSARKLNEIYPLNFLETPANLMLEKLSDPDPIPCSEADLLAGYLTELGAAYGWLELILKMKRCYEKALILYEYAEETSSSFDLERSQKIRILKEQLDQV